MLAKYCKFKSNMKLNYEIENIHFLSRTSEISFLTKLLYGWRNQRDECSDSIIIDMYEIIFPVLLHQKKEHNNYVKYFVF